MASGAFSIGRLPRASGPLSITQSAPSSSTTTPYGLRNPRRRLPASRLDPPAGSAAPPRCREPRRGRPSWIHRHPQGLVGAGQGYVVRVWREHIRALEGHARDGDILRKERHGTRGRAATSRRARYRGRRPCYWLPYPGRSRPNRRRRRRAGCSGSPRLGRPVTSAVTAPLVISTVAMPPAGRPRRCGPGQRDVGDRPLEPGGRRIDEGSDGAVRVDDHDLTRRAPETGKSGKDGPVIGDGDGIREVQPPGDELEQIPRAVRRPRRYRRLGR